MKYSIVPFLILGAVAVPSVSHALDQHQVCIPPAVGVPTRSGPPDWWDPAPPAGTGDPLLDDPRWNQSTGQSFQFGSAEEPLHTRALWANDAGHRFLYLSFISDLFPDTNLPRDIYLGFRRVHPVNGEFAYILDFHIGQPGTNNAAPLSYCGQYSACPQNTNWWRMFVDANQGDGSCVDPNAVTVNGERYAPFNGADIHTPPIHWLDNRVHFWQLPVGGALSNRWAVQLRIPFAPFTAPAAWATSHAYAVGNLVTNGGQIYRCITAGTSAAAGGPTGTASDITDGTVHWAAATAIEDAMEQGSPFWYEATENPTSGVSYLSVAKFPVQDLAFSGVTRSICKNDATLGGDSLVHAELGGSAACTTCNLQAYAALDAFGDPPPAGKSCDGGLQITPANIGSLYDPASHGGFLIDTDSPPNEFSAPQPNRLIAQVKNTTSAPINNILLMARFRLANWGSAPFTPGSTDRGTFDPIPGTESGVTATLSIPAGGQKAITHDWILSDADKCSYQIPGTSCDNTCTCDNTNGCDPDPTTPAGTKGTRPTGTTQCFKLHFPHECMYVELSAPNGGVNFVQQAAYTNMNFGAMSTLAREALIDARKLPVVKGQTYQDIYLMVMPRNLPASLPPNTTTVALVQDAMINSALRISQPYIDDLNRIPPIGVRDLRAAVKAPPPPAALIRGVGGETYGGGDKRIDQILRARQVMAPADRDRVDALLDVALTTRQGDNPSSLQVHDAVAKLGPRAAAEVVPTLDIYPYYLPGARGIIYQPMSAFTVFLSHEGTLAGTHYQIDGATRVAENVYHLRIPVGNARKIQIRAQALAANEVPLPAGNPSWPCAGGCAACGGVNRSCGLVAALGSGGPGLLACVWVIGRRRKPKQRR